MSNYSDKRRQGLVPYRYGQPQNRVNLPLRMRDKEREHHLAEAQIRARENSPWVLPIRTKRYSRGVIDGRQRLFLIEQDWRPKFTAR